MPELTLKSTTRNAKLQLSLEASRLTCLKFQTSGLKLKVEFKVSLTDLCKYSRKMESHLLTCGAMLRESGTKSEKFKDKDQVVVVSNLVKFLQEPPITLETPCSQLENMTR